MKYVVASVIVFHLGNEDIIVVHQLKVKNRPHRIRLVDAAMQNSLFVRAYCALSTI